MHPFVHSCVSHVWKQKLITPQPVDLEDIKVSKQLSWSVASDEIS